MNKVLIFSVACILFITGCAGNHLGKGLSAGRNKNYTAMLKHCSKAARKAHADPLAFKCIGEAQFNLGHRQQAEDAYLTYLGRVPNDFEARFAIVNIYFNAGRYAAAQVHLETVLNIQPGHLEALYLLGESHRLSGNCDAALLAYDKALNISPGYQLPQLSKIKAEQEICAIVEKQKVIPAKPKIIKKKKFQAGGAVLDESDW